MKKNRINEKVIIVIAFVCYIAFNLLCVKVHEHWRDEGQAWMIAKSLSVGELIKSFRERDIRSYGILSLCRLQNLDSLIDGLA